MKKFLKYFRWIFSVSAVFLFVLLNLLNPDFLNINLADASVSGLGASFSGNGSSWNVTVANEGDTYSKGQQVSANFRAFHCNKAGSDPCADNFGLADYDRLLANQNVEITVPAKGSVSSMPLSNESVSCGRVQVDLGSSDGVFGGTVFSMGQDCGGNPAPTPQPSASAPAPLTPVITTQAPACNTLVNSTTCGQPSYDTCVLHYEADGRQRYDCVASQNHLCVGSLYCGSTPTNNPPAQPQDLACPGPGSAGTQQVCGGQWAYDECDIVQRFSDGSPARYSCRFSGNRNGCRGDIVCATPAVACTSNGTCSAPAPSCGQTTTGVDNCNNSCTRTGPACGGTNNCTPTTSQENSCVNGQMCIVNITRNSDCTIFRSAPNCQNATQCGFNPPIPPVQGAPAAPINITNNNSSSSTSSSSNTNNNNITVSAPAAPVTFGSVGVGTNQVLGVKELPKTGLPLLAWVAAAFIPAGFRLRKLGSIKKELDNDPNFIFEDRKFKVRS